jgi:hypothetical protein
MSRLDHAVIEKITQARATNPSKVCSSPIPEKRAISFEQLNAAIEPTTVVEKAKPDFWWHRQMNKSGR